ncbi:hypothetical protein B0J17DRAFT_772977 [Rhizoctonia solani]|nr:hypothetical protein B0J17DRAFT_772977 [Rhizoctonia solani]
MRAVAPDWTGTRKIILGIDIGATQSAVAYSYLCPGKPQTLQRVVEWPGQPAHKGQSRIPSVIYYDRNNRPKLFGAEAMLSDNRDKAEDEGWELVRHFKFHLHPDDIKRRHDSSLEALPNRLSLSQIYSDFMTYLLHHTRTYFCDRVLNEAHVWETYHRDMTIVLAHPNGWGIKQQGFLRKAAIKAGLVTSDNTYSNVQFVSEAEASVHFCMFHTDLYQHMNTGVNFVVCDAGGSTIDTTAYCVRDTSPVLELDETKASACVQAGGVSVDKAFQRHLSSILDKLHLSEELRNDYTHNACREFEENVKKAFDGTGEELRINLGAGRMSNEELNIRRGKLTLTKETVRSFFEESVETAVDSIRQQKSRDSHTLVGGFGESLYLRSVVNSKFSGNNSRCSVTVTSDPNAKAVADGSVLWSMKRTVVSRATRMAYGVPISVPYNPDNAAHLGRDPMMDDDGRVWSKSHPLTGKVMEADEAIRDDYIRTYDNPKPDLGSFSVNLYSYTGVGTDQNAWVMDKYGFREKGFEVICRITADLSGMRKSLVKLKGLNGKYYRLHFKSLSSLGTLN